MNELEKVIRSIHEITNQIEEVASASDDGTIADLRKIKEKLQGIHLGLLD